MNRTTLLAFAAVLSFCSISYEFIIARAITNLTDDVILWQSVTIGIYVAALGLGTFVYERTELGQTRDRASLLRLLLRVETGLTVAGAAALPFVYLAHTVYRIYFYRYYTHALGDGNYAFLIVTICAAQLGTVVIGFLSGFEIPALLALLKRDGAAADGAHPEEGKVLGAGYVGTLVASVGFVLVLPSRLGLVGTALVTASVNGLMALALLWLGRTDRTRFHLTGLLQVLGALAFVILTALTGAQMEQLYLQNRYYNIGVISRRAGLTELFGYGQRKPRVERIRTLYQTIDIVPNQFDDLTQHKPFDAFKDKRYFSLYLNRKMQFETVHEKYYHESMAHVPPMLTGSVPRRVLILGGGDGLLARELLRYKEIQSIVQVELDPEMVRLARQDPRFRRLNQGALDDPRLRLLLADAFSFVRNNREQFDAIFLDFPYPHGYDVSKLYSVEFYRFVSRRLTPGGFLILDFPLFREQRFRRINDIIMSTLHTAGFGMLIPFNTSESFVLAFKQTRAISYRFRPPPFKLEFLDSRIMEKIQAENFPYRITPERVNSVFRPQHFGSRGGDVF